MDNKEWDDAIQEWLAEHDDDDVGVTAGRHVLPLTPEEILGEPEEPDVVERAKAREFSLRWGWIFDLSAALSWWFRSWWTTDVMLGLFRASYGLLMVGLLLGIIYSVFYATKHGPNIRTLPTVDELMRPASPPEDDGTTNPTEGSP